MPSCCCVIVNCDFKDPKLGQQQSDQDGQACSNKAAGKSCDNCCCCVVVNCGGPKVGQQNQGTQEVCHNSHCGQTHLDGGSKGCDKCCCCIVINCSGDAVCCEAKEAEKGTPTIAKGVGQVMV